MIEKIFTKGIQYIMLLVLFVFSISCQGPLVGEEIEFITPNEYKDLSSDPANLVIKTKNGGWSFDRVHYNDTTVNLSTGEIHKVNFGKVTDPKFSYSTKTLNNKSITEISGSFFTITSERLNNSNEPIVITVDITENTSNEKRVLLVELLHLDSGGFFRIEQNHK